MTLLVKPYRREKYFKKEVVSTMQRQANNEPARFEMRSRSQKAGQNQLWLRIRRQVGDTWTSVINWKIHEVEQDNSAVEEAEDEFVVEGCRHSQHHRQSKAK